LLLRYFPVAIVTIIEVFFRLSIQRLIDHGQPFLDRAADLSRNVKFDFRMVSALHGKQVSLGEVLSHFVPLNDLASIAWAMTTLVGVDFLKSVGTTRDRFDVEAHGNVSAPPIIGDIDATCRSIQEVIEKPTHYRSRATPKDRAIRERNCRIPRPRRKVSGGC